MFQKVNYILVQASILYYMYICRPVGRGWAGWARAHPTFGGNRVKYTAVPTQLLEEKGTEKDTIYVPTQL